MPVEIRNAGMKTLSPSTRTRSAMIVPGWHERLNARPARKAPTIGSIPTAREDRGDTHARQQERHPHLPILTEPVKNQRVNRGTPTSTRMR
jgi:hypothetical protein